MLGMRSGTSQSPVRPAPGPRLRYYAPRASHFLAGSVRYRAMGVAALVLAEQRFSVSLQNLADDLRQPFAAP
jgi:hypothetical protein